MMKKMLMGALLLSCTCMAMAQKPVQKWPSFLKEIDLPDGARYIPAPPDTADVAFAADRARYLWGKSMRSTSRGRQAVRDAALGTDSLMHGFAEAFGLLITPGATPQLYRLMSLLQTDAGNSVNAAKRTYRRPRPYIHFNESTAIPAEEESHRHSFSYPSGHSAIGWAIALVMAEINPTRQNAILKRGYEFGNSRVIAGYHYQSDVDASRMAAAAAVARLHADKAFARRLKKTKREFSRLHR